MQTLAAGITKADMCLLSLLCKPTERNLLELRWRGLVGPLASHRDHVPGPQPDSCFGYSSQKLPSVCGSSPGTDVSPMVALLRGYVLAPPHSHCPPPLSTEFQAPLLQKLDGDMKDEVRPCPYQDHTGAELPRHLLTEALPAYPGTQTSCRVESNARLLSVSDLVTPEARYHKICHATFSKTTPSEKICRQTDGG
ncbi:hypothetical protein PR048_023724 [Dryococelus australis]|uniref:Uncharacterized protein n=1 Tax=Dryococelus australis TaxID=614101 RepID=A0ABQ9GUZ9_9NEOP|nr:hypothetical protein PR048_023724 [Dryococelus australis]